jgi:kumamolisin
MPTNKMINVPGSKKTPFRDAHVVAPAPADERLEVTLRLRPRNPLPKAQDLLKPSKVPMRQLTHKEFEDSHGADTADIERIRKFAEANKLTVVRADPARRSVMLSGVVADFNAAFGQKLKTYSYADGTYRGRTGYVRIPEDLKGIVEGVFGLDNRPVASRRGARARSKSASGKAHPFTAVEVAQIYNFPSGLDGSGQTIGIIELGGGYFPRDLEEYFGSLKLPTPTVIPVSVDGTNNSPTTADSDDAEVVLDIEVVGSVAPGATIVVYFAPNEATSKGFLDAITKAVHDTEYNPSVISISWGGPEDMPTTSFQTQFDQVLQEAALLGVTVCVAAGDDGAADLGPKIWDGKAHADFPSSSPFALSCGGTRLITSNGAIQSESVWNQKKADLSPQVGPDGSFGSGGGGVSGVFPVPAYQKQANVPVSLNPPGFKGRGVPDVAGDADPDTGYNIQVDGQGVQEGGTSAVAPLWAGLIALINQKLKGRVGFVNPQLYSLPDGSGVFHDIVTGNNRVSFKQFKNVGYDAEKGWDACSGLGSVDGTKLSQSLTAGGQPQRRTPAASRGKSKAVSA